MEESINNINNLKKSIKSRLSYSFNDYLLERYIEDGGQDPDDCFVLWQDKLPVENIIDYADKYAQECVRKVHAEYNYELKKIINQSKVV